jgi:hypothetical protein
MTIEWSVFMSLCAILLGAAGFVLGGLRFRRWSVEDRIGQPRFPNHIETVLLWLIYSGGVAFVIVLTLQVFRHL